MPKFQISLDDGRSYELEAQQQPTPEEAAQAIQGFHDQPTAEGSFWRGAARSAAPTMAGAFLGGAASGAAAGAGLGPIGSAVVGLGTGLASMWGLSEGQKKLATAINPSADNPFSEASEQRDVATNPFMSEAGGMVGGLFKPNVTNVLTAVRGIGTKEGRQLFAQGYQLQKAMQAAPEAERAVMAASPEAQKALDYFHQTVNVAGNTGVGAGMGIAQGQDPEHILLAAAQGSLFNDSWLHSGAGHPLENPKDAEVHANLDKVAQTDADLARKTTTAAQIINQGAENPLTTHAAQEAAKTLGEKLPQEEAKQQSEIADALKPLAEAKEKEPISPPNEEVQPPTEEPSNASQIESPTPLGEQSSGTQSTRGEGSEGVGQSDQGEASAGTETPQEKVERIVSATYTDDNGQVHEGQNHTEAAAKAGVEAPNSRQGRETGDYGFMVEDANGKQRVVSRQEALQLATENSQLKEGSKIARGRLHSDQVNMGDNQEPAPEPPSTTKITDYNKRGNLAKEVELPHDEAVSLLEPRQVALKLLHDCLTS